MQIWFFFLKKKHSSLYFYVWVLRKIPISALIFWLPKSELLKAWWTWPKILTFELETLSLSFHLLLAFAVWWPNWRGLPLQNATNEARFHCNQSYTMWKLFGCFSKCRGVSGMPSAQGVAQAVALTLAFKRCYELWLQYNGLKQLIHGLSIIKKIKTV